jgi:hypothetical protein
VRLPAMSQVGLLVPVLARHRGQRQSPLSVLKLRAGTLKQLVSEGTARRDRNINIRSVPYVDIYVHKVVTPELVDEPTV